MSRRILRLTAAFGAAVLLSSVSCTHSECPKNANASCVARPSTSSPSAPTGTSTPAARAVWHRIASPPGGARQEVAAAAVDGKIYVAGGLVADGSATARVEAYDPSTGRWSSAPSLPIALHHPMAASFRGRLYVLGGITQRLGGADSARVFFLDGERWKEAPPLKRPRGAGAAVVVGDRIIVVGGIKGSNEVGPAEIFDGTAWRDGASIPSGLDHVAAATDGKLVYVAGGRRGGKHYADFQVYDPAADSWKRLKNMPTARSGLGAAFVGGSVITAGGEGPRMFPEVESYDVGNGAWTRLPNMPVALHGVGVVAIGKTVYAMLGGHKVGVAPSAVCEALTID